jgi:hypothetical protein
MKPLLVKAGVLALALAASGTAVADNNFGIGLKAGTLGIGVEGMWRPLPYMDIRLGANSYDYDYDGTQAGVNYDATLNLETVYATLNFHFPASPLRISLGAYSNGNEFDLVSAETGSYDIGGTTFTAADIGELTSTTSFSSTAPYLGFGFDFSIGGKVGLNMDFGVLWQDEPTVTMNTTGLLANDPTFLAAVETERQQLQDDMSSFKAWPVLSLGFVFNF